MFTGTIINNNFDFFIKILPALALLSALLCFWKHQHSEILLYLKRASENRYSFSSYSSNFHRTTFLTVLLSLLVFTLFASPRMSVYAEVTKGYCGDPGENSGQNVTWSFDSADGTLTISGLGRMQENSYPWESLSGAAKYVIISRGVNSIGPRAFAGFTELSSITIPDSITFIGQNAFENSGLKTITIELVLGGTQVVFDENVFTGTRTKRAVVKVPGYHDVFFSIDPDTAGYNIIEISYGSSQPESDDTLLEWESQTGRVELSASRAIPNSYNVIFEKNASDAAGIMSPQPFIYDKAQALYENQFTRSGYTFIGWAAEAKGGVVYADKAEVKNLTAIQDGTVVLYAKWEKTVSSSGPDLFRLCSGCIIPATGFTPLHPTILSAQPKDLSYKPTGMRMMIPSLNVDMELVTVPMINDSWTVEWLKDRGGILEGSALPGRGITVVAAHNTLNNTEYGPFALLSTMQDGDMITVTDKKNDLLIYRVYANELLEPNDIQKLASIAGQEENAMVLVTCENESAEGGYLNRRVVFAKPAVK